MIYLLSPFVILAALVMGVLFAAAIIVRVGVVAILELIRWIGGTNDLYRH